MRKPTVSRSGDSKNAEWLTPDEAMSIYRIDRQGLYELGAQAGGMVRFGRRLRFYKPLIDEYLLKEYRVQ